MCKHSHSVEISQLIKLIHLFLCWVNYVNPNVQYIIHATSPLLMVITQQLLQESFERIWQDIGHIYCKCGIIRSYGA